MRRAESPNRGGRGEARVGTYNVTEEDVRTLIDEVFEKSPFTGFRHIREGDADAAGFTTQNFIGNGDFIFDLRNIARLSLLNYPPAEVPGLAFVAVVGFLNRLRLVVGLAIDDANDLSLLEMDEAMEAARAIMRKLPETLRAEDDGKPLRSELKKRVEERHKAATHRPYPPPHSEVSIPRLMAALAVLRNQKQASLITIGDLANLLGCVDSAVYKSLSRHGIKIEEFLHVPAKDWAPKALDKFDRFLSKNSRS
jgi:hypothetical protein